MLWALLAWGNRNFAPEGASVVLVNTETGMAADPVLVDRVTGDELVEPTIEAHLVPPPMTGWRKRHKPQTPKAGVSP